jgi:peptide/nickel transport system permease protein
MSCEVSGVPAGTIMFRHLLPNITGPVLISFTFGVAGAILAESGLSFLGFGVQPPTASWGGLLRQAFDNPLDYLHLTFFPGAALFLAVISFNFLGEGMRRALDVK